MMHLTTYAVFFTTGACMGALLASYLIGEKWRWPLAIAMGLASLWFYHNGAPEQNMDGGFLWWGITLSPTGLIGVYFAPLLVFGLWAFARFRHTEASS